MVKTKELIRIIDIDKYIVGCLGEAFSNRFDCVVAVKNAPCPDRISNHPWSIDFIY